MQRIINDNIDQIKQLCVKSSVKSLFAFGSVVNDRFKDSSDIDFIVDIVNDGPLKYADDYFSLKFQLEELLGRKIDLLEKNVLTNRFINQEIKNTGILIYEA